MGSIDVNIMTKWTSEILLKRLNYQPNLMMAHAALRGYANSDLNSSVISFCRE